MKDVSIQGLTLQPQANKTKAPGQPASKGAFEADLNSSIDRLNQMANPAQAAAETQKSGKTEALQQELTQAKKTYDQLMQEKNNLARLFQTMSGDKPSKS